MATIQSTQSADPLVELGRYFAVAAARAAGGEETPMFSGYMDAAWHRLLKEDPAGYTALAAEYAGGPVEHLPAVGTGLVEWVGAYEEAYGPLPDVWFTDAAGVLDVDARDAYRAAGQVIASWDCKPGLPAPRPPADTRAGC
ncbi:hypothetical protein I6A84_39100 [Frankia sp. CNm7]|uniref:Uncharacterized protein n=1 Tax=Frankia nepalensis TaxID=1836974 RepID=A0A937RC02_9ACTN|nr:hypothetical protein [Frankia nepalensis]MBL7496962.1 hypothetical protein [Frankia nepalensis]MBL7511337.1 hypothetical protein [Frankia nepalensis]MBL7523894.1 hypothetical protein [Frankia nepalensis]MBL7626104.1 hypothetical protein [Frankia nepalensis]